MRDTKQPRLTMSKFDCVCAETGKAIERGENCLYDPVAKKAYHMESATAKEFKAKLKKS